MAEENLEDSSPSSARPAVVATIGTGSKGTPAVFDPQGQHHDRSVESYGSPAGTLFRGSSCSSGTGHRRS